MAQSINNLAIGSLVKFGSLHGVPIVWKIADKNHSGYPDNSITLLSDQVLKLMCYDAKEPSNSLSNRGDYGNNRYIYSNIRQWLNSAAAAGAWYTAQHSADAAPNSANVWNGYNPYDTAPGFINGFTADERAALLDTTIVVGKDTADGGGTGITEKCTDKVFLPSCSEVGISSGEYKCGTMLACFTAALNSSRTATVTAACVANSNYTSGLTTKVNWHYWLRDPSAGATVEAKRVIGGGALSQYKVYSGDVGLRPVCNVPSDLKVTDTTDSSGAYTFVWNAAPSEPAAISVPADIYGGKEAAISWGPSTDADDNLAGYILEQCVDSGAWEQIYKGGASSYNAPVTFGWATVQYRVKAFDTVGAESAYTTSATGTVINNRTPVISGSDSNLGSFNATGPSFAYTVTDEDGDAVTVVEKLDGTVLREYTVSLGASNKLTFDASAWQKVLNGAHTLTVTATDALGAAATRTLTFTKAVTSVVVELTGAMAADDMPTKALVNIQGSFPTGSTLTVWVCNNGNDANPTWEEVTRDALNGDKIYFANKTKTAGAWGVKVKVELQRGSATETCYIQSIGGNFA